MSLRSCKEHFYKDWLNVLSSTKWKEKELNSLTVICSLSFKCTQKFVTQHNFSVKLHLDILGILRLNMQEIPLDKKNIVCALVWEWAEHMTVSMSGSTRPGFIFRDVFMTDWVHFWCYAGHPPPHQKKKLPFCAHSYFRLNITFNRSFKLNHKEGKIFYIAAVMIMCLL